MDECEAVFREALEGMPADLSVRKAFIGSVAVPLLESVAGLLVLRGRSRPAALLFGYASAFKDSEDVTVALTPKELQIYEADVARLRDQLGQDLEAAWEEGAEMQIEEALALAKKSLHPSGDTSSSGQRTRKERRTKQLYRGYAFWFESRSRGRVK